MSTEMMWTRTLAFSPIYTLTRTLVHSSTSHLSTHSPTHPPFIRPPIHALTHFPPHLLVVKLIGVPLPVHLEAERAVFALQQEWRILKHEGEGWEGMDVNN